MEFLIYISQVWRQKARISLFLIFHGNDLGVTFLKLPVIGSQVWNPLIFLKQRCPRWKQIMGMSLHFCLCARKAFSLSHVVFGMESFVLKKRENDWNLYFPILLLENSRGMLFVFNLFSFITKTLSRACITLYWNLQKRQQYLDT